MAEIFVTDFGCILGSYQGIDAYSNGNDNHFSAEQNFVGTVYTGIKYQCVEYARRWLLSKNLEFHSVPFASHIWNLKFLERVTDQKATAIKSISNGSSTPPICDSFIIWKVSTEVPWGHIAVITEVNIENGFVRIAEQNVDNDYWPGNYARELKLEVIDGSYWIRDEDEMYGWMAINFDVDSQDENAFNILKPVWRISTEIEKDNISWLDSSNPAQNKFSQIWSDLFKKQRQLEYYTMEAHLAYKIHYATLECNFMCVHSTEAVITD